MQPIEDMEFRRAMGAFATGVAVVTAVRPDGRASGITVNSLTSVSLEPRLMLWCLGEGSARYSSFAEAELWGVAMLRADQEETALRFARAETETVGGEEYELIAGAPVLKRALAQIACRTFSRRLAGDHLIIIGEAMACAVADGDALTFYRGRYGRAEQFGST